MAHQRFEIGASDHSAVAKREPRHGESVVVPRTTYLFRGVGGFQAIPQTLGYLAGLTPAMA